jgi:hypothetical protein
MKYTQNVLFIVNIINKVLLSLNQKSLFQNKDFKIDKELHFKHWVKIYLEKDNSISIIFEISEDGLRIDIDRAEELMSFSYKYIFNNSKEVEKCLFMIFTSTILIQYCGNHLTYLFFIKGKTVQSYKYSTKLWIIDFFKKCKEKIYLPIY